jgi:hypothetical protein
MVIGGKKYPVDIPPCSSASGTEIYSTSTVSINLFTFHIVHGYILAMVAAQPGPQVLVRRVVSAGIRAQDATDHWRHTRLRLSMVEKMLPLSRSFQLPEVLVVLPDAGLVRLGSCGLTLMLPLALGLVALDSLETVLLVGLATWIGK